MSEYFVGMADFKVSNGDVKLTTLGLGSCIGIAIYDPVSRVGGLAHIMLPSIKSAPSSTKALNPAKFGDSGVEVMLKELINKGASRSRMVAKIAGGAHMFNFQNSADFMKVGENNYQSVIKALKENNVRIVAEDCGKNYGRTVTLDLADGKYYIKAVGQEIKVI